MIVCDDIVAAAAVVVVVVAPFMTLCFLSLLDYWCSLIYIYLYIVYILYMIIVYFCISIQSNSCTRLILVSDESLDTLIRMIGVYCLVLCSHLYSCIIQMNDEY